VSDSRSPRAPGAASPPADGLDALPAEPDGAAFVEGLEPAVRQAAAIARALEGRVRNRPKAGESTHVKSALTLADTAAQEAILVALRDRFPAVRLEAEEDTPSVALFPDEAAATAIIDPIDGTYHYYLGLEGPYAVMVGLAVKGRYSAGLVALPREGWLMAAWGGAAAMVARPGSSLRPARVDAEGDRVLVSQRVPEAVCDALRERGLQPVRACGGAVAVAPLLPGVRAGLRAHPGGLGVSIRGRIGAFVAARAGCSVCDESGAPFPLDLETPAPWLLCGAGPDDVALLREAVAVEPAAAG